MLVWCLSGVGALGEDEPAARAKLEPFIQIAVREGFRRRMGLLIRGH